MPMFFALFSVLRAIAGWHTGLPSPYNMPISVVKSAQNANILGAHISDKVLFTNGMFVPLHAKIVILCAVAISVVTTFLTVRQSTKRGMTPQMTPDNPMAASQKYMAYIVPFFALSGLYWAFGLVLYWVTTNVWTLGQQYMLFRRYPAPVPGAATASDNGAAPVIAAPKPSVVSRLTSAKSVPPAKTATPVKPATSARPSGSAKASGTARSATASGSGRTAPKPATSPSARKKPQAGTGAKPPARPGRPATAGQQPSTNGSGTGSGLLRRLGRSKPEPEPAAEQPEVKLVRQQRVRQSRSKRKR
jgi:hypothetical protein